MLFGKAAASRPGGRPGVVSGETRRDKTCSFDRMSAWNGDLRRIHALMPQPGGDAGPPDPVLKLDDGIVRTRWMTLAEWCARRVRHRSPLVRQCIEYTAAEGRRLPLAAITTDASLTAPEIKRRRWRSSTRPAVRVETRRVRRWSASESRGRARTA